MGCPRTWGTKFASPAQLTHVCHQSCCAYNFKQQMRRWREKDIGMGAYNSVFSIVCLRGGEIHNFRIWILCPRTGASTTSIFEFCARVRAAQIVEKHQENKLFWTRLKYKYIAQHCGFSKRKALGAVFTEPQVCLDSTSRQPKWILPLPHRSQKKKLAPNPCG